jgi:TolA-binding protein
MRTALGVGLALALWWGSGCSQESAEQLLLAAEAAAADPTRQAQAVEQFKAFLERYPQHQGAPQALKQLAVLAQQRGEMQEAIAYYRRLLRDYPHSGQGDEAQFMIAFIYEEYLHDVEQARLAYQEVIDNYPESELAASARHLLPNVGRDPEEWVEFQDRVESP